MAFTAALLISLAFITLWAFVDKPLSIMVLLHLYGKEPFCTCKWYGAAMSVVRL